MQAFGQRCNQGGNSHTPLQAVPKQNLCGSQEKRFTQASSKPKTTKPIYGKRPFQDGEFIYDERSAKTGRVNGLDRLLFGRSTKNI